MLLLRVIALNLLDILQAPRKIAFCPIAASGSNFNPQNIQDITMVKIIACLALKQKF